MAARLGERVAPTSAQRVALSVSGLETRRTVRGADLEICHAIHIVPWVSRTYREIVQFAAHAKNEHCLGQVVLERSGRALAPRPYDRRHATSDRA